MNEPVALFWPGDLRERSNHLALASAESLTTQLERALKKVGRKSKRLSGFIAKPSDALERVAPLESPLIAVCAHASAPPCTVEGVVGKTTPLLLVTRWASTPAGLPGLLRTAGCLEMLGRRFGRLFCASSDASEDEAFLGRLEQWCRTGALPASESQLCYDLAIAPAAETRAAEVAQGFAARRALILMLGDSALGAISAYFGPRLLYGSGFSEQKVDGAMLLERGRRVSETRVDAALDFIVNRGALLHWNADRAGDFTHTTTREQLRDYLVVLDLLRETSADCIALQYQLGLGALRPSSALVEGLLNSACRPESNGAPIMCANEADQGVMLAMEMMKRLQIVKGLQPAVMCHELRWGADIDGRFVWVLQGSGACTAYAFSHDPDSLRGVQSRRQPISHSPTPGGTFFGECLPGPITWAHAHVRDDVLWMDIGRGEALRLSPALRDDWWGACTPEWPFLAADLGVGRETLFSHYDSHHMSVAYGDVHDEMVALSRMLGFRVRVFTRGA